MKKTKSKKIGWKNLICNKCGLKISFGDSHHDAGLRSRRFWLIRDEDVSGISGVGFVADGVVFPDNTAVLRWRTAGGSTAVYDSIEKLESIHGHDGRTKIEYIDNF